MQLPDEWKWLDAGSPESSLKFRWALSLIDAAIEPLSSDIINRIVSWPANTRSLDDYLEKWEFNSEEILPHLAGVSLLGNLSCELCSSEQGSFWKWLADQKFVALNGFTVKSYQQDIPTEIVRSWWFQKLSRVSLHQFCIEEWVRAIAETRSTRLPSLEIDLDVPDIDGTWFGEALRLSENTHPVIQISNHTQVENLHNLAKAGVSSCSIQANDLTNLEPLIEHCPSDLQSITLKECVVDSRSLNRLCNPQRFPQLTSLAIDNCTLDIGAGIADIADLKSTCALTSVTSSGDFDFTSLISPSRLSNLEVLDLSYSTSDSSTVDRILELPNKEKLRHLAVSSSFHQPYCVRRLFGATWNNLEVFKAYKQVVDRDFVSGLLKSMPSGCLRTLELRNSDEMAPDVMSQVSDSPAMVNLESIFFPFSWPKLDDAIRFCRSELASRIHSLLIFDTPPGTREEFLRALIDESRLTRLLEWTAPFLSEWDSGLAIATAGSSMVRHLDMLRADSKRAQFKQVFLEKGQTRKVLQAIVERW